MEKIMKHGRTSLSTRPAAVTACRALIACSAVAIFMVGWSPAIAADTAPLAAFGRLPSLEDVVISPDGTNIAFVKTSGESRSLVVAPLTKPEVLGGVRVGDVKLREVQWIDDDNLLVTVSSTSPPPIGFSGETREWYQLVAFNVSKLKLHPIAFDVASTRTFNVVIGETAVRDVSGHSMLYVPGYCVHDKTIPCLFAFAFPDHRARLLYESSEPDTSWLMDEWAKSQRNLPTITTKNYGKSELTMPAIGRWRPPERPPLIYQA